MVTYSIPRFNFFLRGLGLRLCGRGGLAPAGLVVWPAARLRKPSQLVGFLEHCFITAAMWIGAVPSWVGVFMLAPS